MAHPLVKSGQFSVISVFCSHAVMNIADTKAKIITNGFLLIMPTISHAALRCHVLHAARLLTDHHAACRPRQIQVERNHESQIRAAATPYCLPQDDYG